MFYDNVFVSAFNNSYNTKISDFVLDPTRFDTDKTYSFDELYNIYQCRNWVCRNHRRGRVYTYCKDSLFDLNCKQYTCKHCRPALKKDLHDKVCMQVDGFELNYHMVITFPGNDYRNKIDYSNSYRIMNRDWNKLRGVINYYYPGFKYIIFPRAQANPKPGNPRGYCHFHVIHNKKIDKEWLDKKCDKYMLGYTFLRFNEDVAGYLHNDFYSDDEWVIPFNVKHYRSSRCIKINPGLGYEKDIDNIYFTANADYISIENSIIDKYNRCLPFVEYVKMFYCNI